MWNAAMRGKQNVSVCESCRMGSVTKRIEEIAFFQSSDIGPIHCRVRVAIGVCNVCHARLVDEGFDKAVDEAFRQAYGKASRSVVQSSRALETSAATAGARVPAMRQQRCSPSFQRGPAAAAAYIPPFV
jgi:hypothetical protein